jgi:3-deoxy-D-manno-octulosonic-acid transferase
MLGAGFLRRYADFSMSRLIYSLFFYLLLPFAFVRLWWRGRLAPAYRQRWGERLGFFLPPAQTGGIWIHAVSVGETIAAVPMIRELLARYPHLPVCITTMTPTGSERVRALFGEQVFHVYAPYDVPDAVQRFIKRIRPRLAIIMETELWPNMVAICHHNKIPLAVVNARLSRRSARGYARILPLAKSMFSQVDLIAAQTRTEGERFVFLGLPAKNLLITGSIKFDISLPENMRVQAMQLRQTLADRPVWIAASTHAGEDEIILAAHRQLLIMFPELLLVLVPRHPERFDAVEAMILKQGLSCSRRSHSDLSAQPQVLLGDTMGELLMLYGLADVAFVGGSLIDRGGHNMLEAAVWKLPVITGNSDFNFRAISELLIKKGALQKCDDTASLVSAVENLIANHELRAKTGAVALDVVEANRGALTRLMAGLDNYLRH